MEFSKNQNMFLNLGSFFLVLTVVGSGIMADRLSQDDGITLLGNAIPTGLTLVVIISIFGLISGAHFNPVVSLIFWLKKIFRYRISSICFIPNIWCNFWMSAANIIFGLPIVTISTHVRHDLSQFCLKYWQLSV